MIEHGHNTTGTTGTGLTGGSNTTGLGHGTFACCVPSVFDVDHDCIEHGHHGTGTSGIGSGVGSTTGTGIGSTTGTGMGSTTAGPHSSNLANKADPRVDSDLGKA